MAALLAGCATQVPEPIREAPPGNPSPEAVRDAPDALKGERVRWGGTIVSVTNKADHTEVEIVARPLDSDGEPKAVDRSLGRFLARVPGFVDPAVYAAGRHVTVTGTVTGVVEQPIGEYSYRFPVVAVDGRYLWPKRQPAARDRYPYDPFWYDPWYRRSMFYPYCPYGAPRYCW